MKYTLEFFSDWHCGSGLAAGADVDLLVIKDSDGLPFVPGKTIKGLIREAVEDINQFLELKLDAIIEEHFGTEGDKKGTMFFSNAVLPENEHNAIVANNAAKYMYRSVASTAINENTLSDKFVEARICSVASTAINENGIAKNHSLRKMEVAIPCILTGDILDIPVELEGVIEKALKYIKRLGQNRNRGLGRCQFAKI